jgi:hypothetical protein
MSNQDLTSAIESMVASLPSEGPPDGEKPCSHCEEKGFILSDGRIEGPCPECGGSGWVPTN